MNKMVEETVKNMMQQGERTREDYMGEVFFGEQFSPFSSL